MEVLLFFTKQTRLFSKIAHQSLDLDYILIAKGYQTV